jgi:hypothetical protein
VTQATLAAVRHTSNDRPEHGGLAAALLAFQAEMQPLRKDKSNPAFRGSKYVGLDSIRDEIGSLLTRHGLVWQTFPTIDNDGRPALRYKLTHAPSGESEQDTMPLLLPRVDPQGQGSAITYARRYSITAVLDLVADEDDDGNAASRPAAAPAQQGLAVERVEELLELVQRTIDSEAMTSRAILEHLIQLGATDTDTFGKAIHSLSVNNAGKFEVLLAEAISGKKAGA